MLVARDLFCVGGINMAGRINSVDFSGYGNIGSVIPTRIPLSIARSIAAGLIGFQLGGFAIKHPE